MRPSWQRRQRACVALALLLSGTVLAARPVLPPLNDPPTAERLPGKFVWVDLVTPDVDAARKFYAALFGWSYRTVSEPGSRPYTLAYLGDEPIGGIIQRRDDAPAAKGRWVAFMSVPDVAKASQYVVEQGGSVVVGETPLPERGDAAILADPDGVPVGVLSSSSGDRDDFLVDYGDWIWAVYQSPAAEHAAAFYQGLGGYEVVAEEGKFAAPYYLLVAQGYSRASLLQIAGDNPRLKPGWLYFVRVEDVAAQVARSQALGGRTVVAPRDDLLEGRLAVIEDPTGAPVGLLEWQAEEGGE